MSRSKSLCNCFAQGIREIVQVAVRRPGTMKVRSPGLWPEASGLTDVTSSNATGHKPGLRVIFGGAK
jgi:hypothetical protein